MFGDGKTPPDKGADEVFWRYRLADLVIDLAKSFCSETTELIYEFSDVKKDDYRDREFFNTHCQHPLDPWDGNDVLINGTITIRRAHCSFYHRIQTIEADYITVVINFESALDKNNIFDKNELIGMVLNTYDALVRELPRLSMQFYQLSISIIAMMSTMETLNCALQMRDVTE